MFWLITQGRVPHFSTWLVQLEKKKKKRLCAAVIKTRLSTEIGNYNVLFVLLFVKIIALIITSD